MAQIGTNLSSSILLILFSCHSVWSGAFPVDRVAFFILGLPHHCDEPYGLGWRVGLATTLGLPCTYSALL